MHPTEIMCIRVIKMYLDKGWPNNMTKSDIRSMNIALDTYKKITGKDAKVDDHRIVNFLGEGILISRR